MLLTGPQPLGDYVPATVIQMKFTSFSAVGVPTTLAGTPAISIYKGADLTQTTTGVTLTVDFDSVTGLNNVEINTGDAFYDDGNDFQVVVTTGTVAAASVVGYVVASFSLYNRSPLRPTTAARTLDVSAGGEAGVDWANIGAPTTTVALTGTTVGTVTALAAAAYTAAADALLKRDWTAVTGEAARSTLNALRILRNRWFIASTTLTVTKEDDTTAAWSAVCTTNASAIPVTGTDPS